MQTFGQWLEVGIVYSNPVNDDRYAQKGVRSNREGDKAAALPGVVDPDAMFLGTPEDKNRGGKLHKKRRSLSK